MLPSILTSFSPIKYVLSVVILIATGFLYKFIISPYVRIQSKKKDGVMTYFYPIYGIFHQWGKAYETYQDSMASTKRSSKDFPNQKIMVTNVNDKVMVMLRDPQYAKDFSLKQHLYTKSSHGDIMKILLGTSLVFAEGEAWKRNRRIISNTFHFEFLKSNIHLMQSTTQEFLNKLDSTQDTTIIKKFQEITGEIVGRIFFGECFDDYKFEGKPLTHALAEIMGELGTASRSGLPLFFGPKAMELSIFPHLKKVTDKVKRYHKLCSSIIQDRRSNGSYKGDDLLNALLETQKSEDPQQRYTDEDIVYEFVNFFAAGMESTGLLIGMAVYSLAKNPQYLEDLREERNKIYNTETNVTPDIVQKMDFTHAVLKETLRLYAPVFQTIIREAQSDHQLVDITIKKGEFVTDDFFALQFDEKYFPDPYEFNPRRWLGNNQKTDPYAYTPFWAGPRNCNGQHLAIMESKIILSEFLNRFDFQLEEGYDLRMIVRVLYEPFEDFKLKLSPIPAK